MHQELRPSETTDLHTHGVDTVLFLSVSLLPPGRTGFCQQQDKGDEMQHSKGLAGLQAAPGVSWLILEAKGLDRPSIP